ncbi:MAG: hypothetical protein KC547_05775 [Anaerolineae bacterium]|nr:hypothetical protein [Anaerolineae bacterium]
MSLPVKHTSFQSAIDAAARSKVDIRNLLTGATVQVRAEDVQPRTTGTDSNGHSYSTAGTASAAGALLSALVATIFGMDAPLAVNLDIVNKSVIKITVIDERVGPQDEQVLRL